MIHATSNERAILMRAPSVKTTCLCSRRSPSLIALSRYFSKAAVASAVIMIEALWSLSTHVSQSMEGAARSAATPVGDILACYILRSFRKVCFLVSRAS